MLKPLAFDEYCRFDTSAFFMRIKRGSLYRSTHKESRSIKEREGKLSNPRARRACDAWRKFTEIYGNPRARAARAMHLFSAGHRHSIGKSDTDNLPTSTDLNENFDLVLGTRKTIFCFGVSQKSASVVRCGITLEFVPWRPFFEKCSHLRDKVGVKTLRTPVGLVLTRVLVR
jgi:hypothetical protein